MKQTRSWEENRHIACSLWMVVEKSCVNRAVLRQQDSLEACLSQIPNICGVVSLVGSSVGFMRLFAMERMRFSCDVFDCGNSSSLGWSAWIQRLGLPKVVINQKLNTLLLSAGRRTPDRGRQSLSHATSLFFVIRAASHLRIFAM